MEDISSVAFIVSISSYTEDNLVGFHLFIPMEYVEPAALFCTSMEAVKDRVLNTPPQCNNDPPQPLEDLTERISPNITN